MVFKKLCKDLEDPSFEIDEEAYRKFKLSERWYAREERKLRKHIDEANSHTPVSQTPTSNSPELDKQSPSVPETVPEEEEKEQVQHDQLPERKRTRSDTSSTSSVPSAII
ncbi:hypothetical protein FBU59_007112 [Linderina macrospora]|uniref:Uncharacterized protein n=1 Tax=Linderina macrospora TaxID=4868 RepID=A0ACC1IY17_9FUNG|nr:hypothetical protein FBU59_007112 [Linderina macrospora]